MAKELMTFTEGQYNSLMEVHFEISTNLYDIITSPWRWPKSVVEEVSQRVESDGLRNLCSLAQHLTEKFQLEYKGADWSDMDFYLEVVEFLEREV